jgi:hypothetical protein
VGTFQDETKESVSQTPLVKKVTEEVGAPILTDEDIEESLKNLNVDTSNIEIGTFQKETEYSVSQKTTKENITPDIDQLEEQQAIVVEKQGEDKVIQTVSTTKERQAELIDFWRDKLELDHFIYLYSAGQGILGSKTERRLKVEVEQEEIPRKLLRPAFTYINYKVSGTTYATFMPAIRERYNLDGNADWVKDRKGEYIIQMNVAVNWNFNTKSSDKVDKSSPLWQHGARLSPLLKNKLEASHPVPRSWVENVVDTYYKKEAELLAMRLIQDGTLT